MSDIELDELASRLDDTHLTVIDVRALHEYDGSAGAPCDPRQGHIPGALHVELTKFLECATVEDVHALVGAPAGAEIAAYCHSGARSAVAVQILNAAGYEARNYAGSWHEWAARVDLPAAAPRRPGRPPRLGRPPVNPAPPNRPRGPPTDSDQTNVASTNPGRGHATRWPQEDEAPDGPFGGARPTNAVGGGELDAESLMEQTRDRVAIERIHQRPPVAPKRSVLTRAGGYPNSTRAPATVSTKLVGPQTNVRGSAFGGQAISRSSAASTRRA